MRIALVSPPGEGHLGSSLGPALEAEGHEVALVAERDLTGGSHSLVRARRLRFEAPLTRARTAALARAVAASEPDLVLVMRGRFLRAADVRRLRRAAGAPVVNYQTDNALHPGLREQPLLRALAAYDLVVAFASELAAGLARLGAPRTAVLPFAYDPVLYPPRPEGHPYRYDVCFVGSWNPVREEHVRRLAGLELAVAGGGWARALAGTTLAASVLEGRRWGLEAARVYWSSRVGLNVLHESSLLAHNMRTYELPATRTATVATRTADHERLYGVHGAVLIDGPDQLRPAVERLLADDAYRVAIAEAGLRAVAAGTYRARARELSSRLEELRR